MKLLTKVVAGRASQIFPSALVRLGSVVWQGLSMTDALAWISTKLSAGVPVALGRIVSVSGFGGKRSGEIMAISCDESVGELALGAANEATRIAALDLLSDPSRKALVVKVPIGDAEAVAAGLACGGSATVLVEAASHLPSLFLNTVHEGRAVVLVSGRNGSVAVTATQAEGSLASNADDEVIALGRRMLEKGPIEMTKTIGEHEVFLTLVAPQPRLLVFGEAQLATALVNQGNLVGWVVDVRPDKGSSIDEAVALAATTGPLDGVVVLSHDIGVSCSVLAAALNARCGYVGALGSRHTQTARSECLEKVHGLDSQTRERVHGPVGLNIGSRTPEETALAIVAEMIAARSLTTE